MTKILTQCLGLAGLISLLATSHGNAQENDFLRYRLTNDGAIITGFSADADTDIVIPSEIEGIPVVAIGDWDTHPALSGPKTLTSISIPASVRDIYTQFGEFPDLRSIAVAPANTSYASEDGALFYSGLTHLVRVPRGRTGNYSIPDGVEGVFVNVFRDCTSLLTIAVPSSLTDFYITSSGCSNLKSIDVHPDNRRFVSIDGVLFNKAKTQLLAFPEGRTGAYTVPDGVRTIGNGAFSNCRNLNSLSIPSSVTQIGERAFENCTGLTSFSVPEGVTRVEPNTFRGCIGLTDILIPTSVDTIGWGAFSGCSSLTQIAIPAGVVSIGHDAFYGCSGLTAFAVAPENASYTSVSGVLFDAEKTTLIAFPEARVGTFDIPEGVTSIAYNALRNRTGLTSLSIPSTLASIDRYDFTGCSGLTSITVASGNPSHASWDGALYNSTMTELIVCPEGKAGNYTIPDGVTAIGVEAFHRCSSLKSISIPASVIEIRWDAFTGCTSLTAIEVAPESLHFSSTDGVLFNAEMTELVAFPGGRSGAYSVPDGVTHIGPSSFSNCIHLTDILIPGGVTTIEREAFSGCTSLTNLFIPLGVTHIGYRVFADCTGLTRISLPESVTRIGGSAFSGCTALTSLTIPSRVTAIGNWAFRDCSSLTSISLPETISEIGTGAFSDCSSLTDFRVPEGVTTILPGTFAGCSSMTSVVVGSLVRRIYFGRGTGFASIITSSFAGCNLLTSVTFLGPAPVLQYRGGGGELFDAAAPGFTIYFLSCSSGFTTPTWHGYPAEMIGEEECPKSRWLAVHNFPVGTDLSQDLNGDGVSLLMAYALDLDPHTNLANSLPKPVINTPDHRLSITFHAAARDVSYSVETSTDLRNWTEEGVSISPFDLENRRTASVYLYGDETRRFLRLIVGQ